MDTDWNINNLKKNSRHHHILTEREHKGINRSRKSKEREHKGINRNHKSKKQREHKGINKSRKSKKEKWSPNQPH
jgi:hypothetical protein